jgi:hypothetical protein
MYRRFVFIAFFIFTLHGSSCFGIDRAEISAAARKADLIFVGECLSGVGSARWRITFFVKKTLKGIWASERIEVEYPPTEHSFDLMRSRELCIVFLTRNGNKYDLLFSGNDRKSIVLATDNNVKEVKSVLSTQ